MADPLVPYTGAVWSTPGTQYLPVANLGDRTPSTAWCPGGATGNATVTLAAPAEVTYYAVTAYATYAGGFAPNDWTLEGSNDGTAWTLLDSHTVGKAMTPSEACMRVLSTPASYSRYRLSVANASAHDWTYVGGLDLYTGPPPMPEAVEHSGFGIPI